ncbi:MAG TPA: thioredoxin family protein [Candidatus Gracilibacteria bacterium]|nr:thioredoxin family protein [Candidatus Gracilibacteria bacterium]
MVLLESFNVPLGTPAPEFSLRGIDDAVHALREYQDAKVLAVIFMCNHCPYVQAQWPRLVELQEKFKDRGVQFIGINANSDADYPEDSFEKMKEYAEKFRMNFPYLRDETQEVGRSYKAQCTPDIFVYDEERKLAYHGRVDDNWKEREKVTRHELQVAVEALLAGRRPSDEQKPAMGCSIKWRE